MISGLPYKVVQYFTGVDEIPTFDYWADNLVYLDILGNWVPIKESIEKKQQFVIPVEAFLPLEVVDMNDLKEREDFYQFLTVKNTTGGIAVIGQPKENKK